MEMLLIGPEIYEIVKYINVKLIKYNTTIKQSIRKGEKINLIFKYMGTDSSVKGGARKGKKKAVDSLKSLCITELTNKRYPKLAVAASYTEAVWPSEESKWYGKPDVCVTQSVLIEDCHSDYKNQFQPVYSPQINKNTGEMQVQVLDGTHMRTNIKSKIIQSGIKDVAIKGWKEVAKDGKTLLSPPLLEVSQEGKLIHQQSDQHVRTMFCEEVGNELESRGYSEEAEFCQVFRGWHEAEDKPGISAKSRVVSSLRLREWLMSGYQFSRFPPATMYVKGIPRVTFEGLVCSIDAHILLYAICKQRCYNWRTVSTLVAENFMGELAERARNNHGVPSGHTLASDMTVISELHAMRMNPNRAFQMRTARSRAYTVPEMECTGNIDPCSGDTDLPSTSSGYSTFEESMDLGSPNNDSNETTQGKKINKVILRNHEFDHRCPGKVKFGTVRTFGEVPRGVQSVRTNYHVAEDKIIPSESLGLSEELNDI